MEDRKIGFPLKHCAVAVVALMMVAANRQTPGRAIANDPVAIDVAGAPLLHATSMGPPAPLDDSVADVPDAHSAADDPAAVEVAADDPAPASESIPLGAPNDLLSARPAEDEAADGRLASLDPRTNEFIRVAGALAAVLALLLGMRWSLRRVARRTLFGAGSPSGVVEILGRYPIARSQHLLLMKVARRVLVLHQSGSAMHVLSEFNDADEVAALLGRIESGSEGKQASRFQSMLKDFRAEHDATAASARLAPGSENEFIDLTQQARPRARRGWRLTA
jgi:flagellar biogenesis protein FliO